MSAFIASAMKIIFGLAANKLRRYLSDHLKDGDLNAQMAREVIVSELAEVKAKLEGLARSDLLSSVSFLQEGLATLDSAFPDVADKKTSGNLEGSVAIPADATQKLVKAIGELKITSTDHFTSAMKSFEKANTKATEAFHNEALSIEDRILAAKLRVQSRLLTNLENPDLANACKLYLEELHSVPAVVEIFRNVIEGGVLSALNKVKRLELALSVSVINFTVFRFLKSFTKGPVNLYNWPMVKRDDWMYNALTPDETILRELDKAEEEVPNFMSWKIEISSPHSVAVDSQGDLMVYRNQMNRRLFNTRELLKVTNNDVQVFNTFSNKLVGSDLSVAIDNDNKVFVIEKSMKVISRGFAGIPCFYEIRSVDPQGNFEDFRKVLPRNLQAMAPTPEGCNIAECIRNFKATRITPGHEDECKPLGWTSGVLREKPWGHEIATITDTYETVAVHDSGHVVRVYKKDGQLEKEFELYEGIQERCLGITFNNLTKEVVVISLVRDCYYLSTYLPKTGERLHHVKLPQYFICEEVKKRNVPSYHLNLTSHSSGVIALITKEHVLYIQ